MIGELRAQALPWRIKGENRKACFLHKHCYRTRTINKSTKYTAPQCTISDWLFCRVNQQKKLLSYSHRTHTKQAHFSARQSDKDNLVYSKYVNPAVNICGCCRWVITMDYSQGRKNILHKSVSIKQIIEKRILMYLFVQLTVT